MFRSSSNDKLLAVPDTSMMCSGSKWRVKQMLPPILRGITFCFFEPRATFPVGIVRAHEVPTTTPLPSGEVFTRGFCGPPRTRPIFGRCAGAA